MFIGSLKEECIYLLESAHEYFSLFGEDDLEKMTTLDRICYSVETTRITLRLSSIIRWIRIQELISMGNVPPKLREDLKLPHQKECLEENTPRGFPAYVIHLMRDSLALYKRVKRLDDQAQKRIRYVEAS